MTKGVLLVVCLMAVLVLGSGTGTPAPVAVLSHAPQTAVAGETAAGFAGSAGHKPLVTFAPMTRADFANVHRAPSGSAPRFLGALRAHVSTRASGSPSTRLPATSTSTPSGGKAVLFNGLNAPGISAADNLPQGFAPPDPTGSIGPNNYVEIANSIINVRRRSDLGSIASLPLGTFVGAPGAPLCDPQVQWDQASGRWLYSMLLCDTSASPQLFLFGWSKTSDPSNLASGWCTDFAFNTSRLIFDYDKLGHNSGWIILGGNFYDTSISATNPPFVTAALAWVQMPANGVQTCPSTFPTFHTFPSTGTMVNGDHVTPAFTPVPVNTDSSASNGYVVSSYDVGGNVVSESTFGQSTLAVWHVDASGVLHQDPDIVVNQYNVPGPAVQPGTSDQLDTLDGRLTQAVGDPTSGIWTQHTVAVGNPALPNMSAQAAWYELVASGTSLVKAQEGRISGGGDDVFNAAISPSFSGDGAAIVYNRSGPSTEPLIAVRVRRTGTPLGQMAGPETVLATSPASDTDFTCLPPAPGVHPLCRWGDYAGMSPDPVQTNAIWGTGEYNTLSSGGLPKQPPEWQNENFAVLDVVPPDAPTGVTGDAGNRFACVRWTPPSTNAGAPISTNTITAYVGASVAATLVINANVSVGCVLGLTNGTAYTFTVTAGNIAGMGPESAHSAPVTPSQAVSQSSPVASAARTGINQAPPAPTPPPRP